MSEAELFSHPTVKEVHFEIRFPHIFSIENKIGDIQMEIFQKFPESSLIVRSNILLVDKGPEGKLEQVDEQISRKMWKFQSGEEYETIISTNRIGILSKIHTSYNSGEGEKFREIIEYVINNFFKLIPISKVSRIGLRYVDIGPLPEKTNEKIVEYYHTTFPINRFDLNDAYHYEFIQRSKIDDIDFMYRERLIKDGDDYKIRLDYDTYITDIPVTEILPTTDRLHAIHKREWRNSLKEPVFRIMRGEVVE